MGISKKKVRIPIKQKEGPFLFFFVAQVFVVCCPPRGPSSVRTFGRSPAAVMRTGCQWRGWKFDRTKHVGLIFIRLCFGWCFLITFLFEVLFLYIYINIWLCFVHMYEIYSVDFVWGLCHFLRITARLGTMLNDHGWLVLMKWEPPGTEGYTWILFGQLAFTRRPRVRM